MDLISSTQSNAPFTLGIQIEWQLEMMAKFGHNITLSIDTTFGTFQIQVQYFPPCPSYYMHVLLIIYMSYNVPQCHSFLVHYITVLIGFTRQMYLFVTVSAIHGYGF